VPRVVLTILPPWGRPTINIGLGYISEYLLARGVDHQVMDFNAEIYNRLSGELADLWLPQRGEAWVVHERFSETMARIGPHVEWAARTLAESDAEVLGFSTNQSNLRVSVEVAKMVRRMAPDKRMVFGGLGVYLIGERLLVPENLVDIFVIGEGERTFLRLLEKMDAGEPWQGTAGTIVEPWRLEYEPRAHVDLRRHPWPRYGRFQVDRYPNGAQPFPISLGRGCVCRCTFCGDYPFWGKYRSRSGAEVVEEIVHHVEKYGIREFEFNDLAINGDIQALEEMCDGIIERGLDIHWSSYAYIAPISDELTRKLRRSGCVMLRFGMESASNSVLRRMRKPHRAEIAAEVLARLDAAGIKCNIGLMAGFPQETDAEIDETIAFLEANQAHINEVDSLSIFYIKPLSYIERHPEKFGILFPEDHHVRWNRWTGQDGSTYEKRRARAFRLIEALEGTSIRFQRCNIFGLSD